MPIEVEFLRYVFLGKLYMDSIPNRQERVDGEQKQT